MNTYNTNNIIPKQVNLIDCQIDIILKALELYSFNLHNTWGVKVDSDEFDLKNALVFHTYESLISQKNDYRISYDLMKEYRLEQQRKRKKIYLSKKIIA